MTGQTGESPARAGRARAVVQLVGFCLGIALLAWCASIAFSEGNRRQLNELTSAKWTDIALLVILSVLTLGFNGAGFWAMIRPVRRVPMGSVLLVNSVASALSYLPFKLSLVFRAAAHNRRDGVPLLTIGTWIGNVGVVMLAVIGPALAASIWRQRVDGLWWATAVGGGVVICAAMVLIARVLSRPGPWHALERRLLGDAEEPLGWRKPIARSRLVPRVHEGVFMMAHPSGVFGAALLRAIDIGALAARFAIAARIVGFDLPADQAVAAASAYFVIGVLSPLGVLGFREIGLTAQQSESFAVVVLTVTAIEMVVNLACAVPAAALLRPRRGAGAGITTP